MAAYFAEHLEGMSTGGLVRSYGNRYYPKPVITGDIGRRTPITVDWWRYAQSLTQRPVKGMLTGPYTIADWSFIERYATRDQAVMALARVINEEARDLEAAGAHYIQIDEPAVSTRPEELPLVVEAMRVVTRGVGAHTITHMCYGDFTTVYPGLLEMPVDQIDLELTNSSFDTFELFRRHPFTKELAVGVVDVHSHRVPSEEEVVAAIRRGLEVVPPERLYVDPDCGLKTRTVEEAQGMMRVIRTATDRIKRELGAQAVRA
jgi:5-methyltetrahydropteroyltriglutamate--homocysteine methyltransferase